MSTVEAAAGKAQAMVRDSVKTVIAASMVGTAIEFYDFYAYGTAAANYFPKVFFGDTTNPTVALLASLLTFAIAFIARPLGSLVFGHFGDRMGRKTTLVVSLLTMGIATFLIGCLPTYNQWGVAAVAVLCLCRFVQGIGLGGEWSGAALVATENAPEDKRALYGSFPELGAPIGFFLSNGTYFLLETFNDNDAMLAWGWRVPFLLSSILVIVGLVVRVQMEETPIFRMAQEQKKVVKSPLTEVFKKSWKEVIQATFLVAVTYTLFYTLATWSLAWGTKTVEQGGGNLGFSNQEYLLMLMIAVCVFAAFIVISCVNADKFGRKKTLVVALMLMGIATFVVGLLPGYEVLGPTSVVLLCVCRACQGLGLGGEWSGAALVATENAPKGKRALYGAFPNMGAPIGFFCAYGVNLLLDSSLPADAMVAWGWRIPFLLSALLVVVGLVVRLRMTETPVFQKAQRENRTVKMPLAMLLRHNWRQVVLGTCAVSITYTLFYVLGTWSRYYGV